VNSRRHGTRPTIALWSMVVVADVMLLLARTGVLAMLLVIGVVTAVAVVGLARHGSAVPTRATTPFTLRTRRGA
jgi:hypothetical protein